MSADHSQQPTGSAANPASGYGPQSGTQGYEAYAQQYAAYAQQQQQAQNQSQPSSFPVGAPATASTTQSAYGNNNATVPAAAGSGTTVAASQPPNPYTGNPEGKRAHLYVGNLSPRVTEYMLQEIFSVAGPVQVSNLENLSTGFPL